MADIYSGLSRVFCKVFNLSEVDLNADTTANDIEGWDSLRHIVLLTEIEREFNIKISLKSAMAIKTVGDLANSIRDLLEK